jgi:hypothetical protein
MLHAVCCTLHGVRCTSMLDVVRCGVVCCVLHGLRRMLHAAYVACCMLHVYVAACRLSALLHSGLPARERLLKSQSRVRHTPLGPFYSHPLPPPGRLPSLLHADTHMKVRLLVRTALITGDFSLVHKSRHENETR